MGLFGSGTAEAEELAKLDEKMLLKLSEAVENKAISRQVSLMENEVLSKMSSNLLSSPDYVTDVKIAVDELLLLMVRFVASRQNAQADRKPYLFKSDASENDLHEDLFDFLYSSLGSRVEMETPSIGGGRVDIRAKYSTFSIYMELKLDGTKKALADKLAFVNQSVTYQATDARVGFLVALRTKASPSTGAHPHLVSLFEHTTVTVPGDAFARHVVLIDVPGNRTSPSDKRSV